MGRRVKAYKIPKKYQFLGLGLVALASAIILVTLLSLAACRRNPLMSYIEHSGISVKIDGKTIEKGDSHDLGRVKQGESYPFTFDIINSGNLDLELTGSPFVRFEGGAATMFDITQQPVDFTGLIKVREDANFILSYDPKGEGQTDIQVNIENNSGVDNFSFELTSYVDGTPPTIDAKYPQGTGWPTNVVVSATFSEEMDYDTIDETTFTLTGSVSGPIDATVSYNTTTNMAYLSPNADLSATEWHTVALSTSSITDIAGNLLSDAGGGIWVFQTGTDPDNDPPVVDPDLTVPLDGAIDIPLDTVVSATFDEDINPSTLSTDTFKLLKGAVEVEGSVSYDALTKTGTFTPDVNLDPSTDYTARLTAGIEDTIGNATTSPYYEWTFRTEEGVDNTAPTYLSRNPDSGASDVPTNTIISVQFNESIDDTTLTTSTFTLTDAVSGAVAAQGDVILYDSNSMTATFIPASSLTGGRLFTVTLTSGIADEAGNNLSPTSWTFNTGAGSDSTAPTVSSTSPVDLVTDVPVNAAITATFSEVMDATTINTSTFKLLEDGVEIAGTVSYISTPSSTATFTPAHDLDEAKVFTARITTGAKDAAGNSLALFEWTFTTVAGSLPPEVDNVSPAGNAIDVDPNTGIVVQFSKLMDNTTINTSTFMVSPIIGGVPDAPIAGTVSYNNTTREATFAPSSTLTGFTEYLVECTAGMTDIGGNALTYFSSLFTTAADNTWGSMKWSVGKWAP